MDIGSIAQLLTAAGLGGVVSSLVVNSSDRREQRSKLLSAIADYEASVNLRDLSERDKWLDGPYISAALQAGLPRKLVAEYLNADLRLAKASADQRSVRASRKTRERASGQDLPRTEREDHLSEVYFSAEKCLFRIRALQVQMIWHPWVTRVYWRLLLRKALRGQPRVTRARVTV